MRIQNIERSTNIAYSPHVGGHALGIDLGVATRMSTGWSFSMVLSSLNFGMNWTNGVRGFASFEAESISVINIIRRGIDSLVTHDTVGWDTLEAFNTPIPSFLIMGVAWEVNPTVLLTADITYGFSNTPLSSTKAQFSLGFEYSGIDFLALRAGLAFGGSEKLVISYGCGLHLGKLHLDAGFQSIRGFLWWSKGNRVSLNAGYVSY